LPCEGQDRWSWARLARSHRETGRLDAGVPLQPGHEKLEHRLGRQISRRIHYRAAEGFTGHEMPFSGLPDQQERTDLIAYLETLK
jgi:hypothetical protein